MGTIAKSSFEGGLFSPFSPVIAGQQVVVQQDLAYHGDFAVRCTKISFGEDLVHGYFYYGAYTIPAGGQAYMTFFARSTVAEGIYVRMAGGSTDGYVYIYTTPDGRIALARGGYDYIYDHPPRGLHEQVLSSAGLFVPDTWYRFDVLLDRANNLTELLVNGNSIGSISRINKLHVYSTGFWTPGKLNESNYYDLIDINTDGFPVYSLSAPGKPKVIVTPA